ncbi:hypothetical protein [Reichenbachiella sp. MALMAid0571]|uniref:hypothetical protein n=1 Tax=Reichenbachiella sp. MALMAid0571 TaxID=3143939 RepID=UPI0032E00B48
MIKQVIIAITSIILIFGELNGQDLKKKSKIYNVSNSKSTYHVLKSDNTIRHGDYSLVDSNKILKAKGKFNNNEKVGLWDYYRNSGGIVSKYTFDHNRDTLIFYGIALLKDEYGNIVRKLDFKEVEAPADPIGMEDNIVLFHEDFSNTYISKYGQSNFDRFHGKVYFKMNCTEQQLVINPEVIINKLSDSDRDHLLEIARHTLKQLDNKRVLFINKEGNLTSGEVIIPMTFR